MLAHRQCSAYKKDGIRCTRKSWGSSTCRQHRFSKNGPKPGIIEVGPKELTLTISLQACLGYFKELPQEIESLIKARMLNNFLKIDEYIALRGLGGNYGPQRLSVQIVNVIAVLTSDNLTTNDKISSDNNSNSIAKTPKSSKTTQTPVKTFYDSDNESENEGENDDDDDDEVSGEVNKVKGPKIEAIMEVKVQKDLKTNRTSIFNELDLQNLFFNLNILRYVSSRSHKFILEAKDWLNLPTLNCRDYFTDEINEELKEEEKQEAARLTAKHPGKVFDPNQGPCIDFLDTDYKVKLLKINGYAVKTPYNECYGNTGLEDTTKMISMINSIFQKVIPTSSSVSSVSSISSVKSNTYTASTTLTLTSNPDHDDDCSISSDIVSEERSREDVEDFGDDE